MSEIAIIFCIIMLLSGFQLGRFFEAWVCRKKIFQCIDKKEIECLEKVGHTYHCACRQVWGDGECECHLYEKGYNPYEWSETLKNERPKPDLTLMED